MKLIDLVCVAFMTAMTALAAPALAADRAGFYATLEADADDCARACAEDSLCVAWTHQDASCGLSAAAPQSLVAGAHFGLSPNAPAFIRAQFAARQTPEPTLPEPPPATQVIAARHEDTASLELLGGPDEDALRPQLALRN